MLFALGDGQVANWAAFLFMLARFIDHADGELARLTGRSSRFGYYYDTAVGSVSYGALFIGLGTGLTDSALGVWSLPLGAGVGIAVFGQHLYACAARPGVATGAPSAIPPSPVSSSKTAYI